MTPSEIAPAAFGQRSGAVLMAAGDPLGTCRTARAARELDYFFASSGMADGVDAIEVVPSKGVKTHVPVEMRFKPRLASIRALIVRRPPKLGTERLIGPLRQVVQWDSLKLETEQLAADAKDEGHDLDGLQRRLGEAFRKWADAAELELMEATYDGYSMPKTGLRGRAPQLVWRSILPERPTDIAQGRSARWRDVANAALDAQRIATDVTRRAAEVATPRTGGTARTSTSRMAARPAFPTTS
jgi:hypothetical protein